MAVKLSTSESDSASEATAMSCLSTPVDLADMVGRWGTVGDGCLEQTGVFGGFERTTVLWQCVAAQLMLQN